MKIHAHALTSRAIALWPRALLCTLGLVIGGQAGADVVSQDPLSAGGNVPGNLVLTPSVEWPTLDSVANLDAAYVPGTDYVGYFDSEKCYGYNYDALVEQNRYFFPQSIAAGTHVHSCAAATGRWSGNFLNWATTQTIDPFRKALTGGNRKVSTVPVGTVESTSVTILEKAYADTQAGTAIFPDQTLSNATITANATPIGAGWGLVVTRVRGLGIRMRFTYNGDLSTGAPTIYNPTTATFLNTTANRAIVYELSVRVKVCDPVVGVETNCVQYSAGWKPEGLIQKYANRMRYSVFGYLNDPNDGKSGAALRARQKFVGPLKLDPTAGWVANTNKEWDATTGVLIKSPDPTDASNTTGTTPAIVDSGVINYLNKFGSTGSNHKQHDPVSEMYYSAIRYLRNKSYPAEYGVLSGTAAVRYTQADAFPVITTWPNTAAWDPIQYRCQNNAILGIGDVYTWFDKNVPGGGGTGEGTTVTETDPGSTDSPANIFNAATWLPRISQLEFGNTTSVVTPFMNTSGSRENSAYIAALAYWAHVTDIRTEASMTGKQTVSTYWVDVREAKKLESRRANQYWLAAKYGGFVVPDGYNPASPPVWQTSWWNGTGDTLTSSTTAAGAVYASETMGRPDNFYVGNQADKMVESLTRAFAKIASERAGSGSSLAANSTRLDTSTRVYQAQFRNGSWFGQINAYTVDPATGLLSASPTWRAGQSSTLAAANWAARNIYTNNPAGSGYVQFRNANLSVAQKAKLTFTGMGPLTSADVVDYIRGKQTSEESYSGGYLRTRTTPDATWSVRLGDIVNSTPIYVGAPNAQLFATAPLFNGRDDYGAFALAQAGRTQALWVGANDGMLHAFNASNGDELYAFVPNASIMNGLGLGQYANPDYVHKYFVDGDVSIADVYIGGAWKTVLVGTMGRGGPGIFALDVTNPNSVSLLWEKTTAEVASLGRNIGRPVIAQVDDGDWRVILGNGVDSADTSGHILTIELDTGDVTDTQITADTSANGLSSVLARDTNGDGFADTAYAGDLKGNLWKFYNLKGSITVTQMYTAEYPASVRQPITVAPLVGRDPSTGTVWVFFGTGKYLGSGDVTDTSQQTWYAIKDNGTTGAVGRSTLVARTASAGLVVNGFPSRIITTGTAADLVGKQGWYIDFPISKERMVSPSRFQGGAVIGTTRIPDTSDVCDPSGKGYLMAVNPFTGGRLEQTFFDTNRDGLFNDADKSGLTNIISGVGLNSMPNSPIFVENVALISLTSGATESMRVQGSSVDASRMSWREIIN